MSLPDWSNQIFTYVNAFLNWSPFFIMATISVAAFSVGVIASMFMRVFMRG